MHQQPKSTSPGLYRSRAYQPAIRACMIGVMALLTALCSCPTQLHPPMLKRPRRRRVWMWAMARSA